jgi:hypothetical protein
MLIFETVIFARQLRSLTKLLSGTPKSFAVEQNYFREHPKAPPLDKTAFGNTRKFRRWTKQLSGTSESFAVEQNYFRELPKAPQLHKTMFGKV